MGIYRGDMYEDEKKDGKVIIMILTSDLYKNNIDDAVEFIKSIKIEDWNILQ